MKIINLKSLLIGILCFALVEVSYSLNAHAGMISTSAVVMEMTRNKNLEKVNRFYQNEKVQSQMVSLGVSPVEVSERIASLNDNELQKLAAQIDTSQAGGDVIVIGLGTVLLIVLILVLIGRV